MDKLIVRVSAKIDKANECRLLIQDLAGKLQISLASEKTAYESIGGTTGGTVKEREAKQKIGIWEGVSPAMKKVIQDYWKQSQAQRSKGKRILIGKFCTQRDLDEKTFRAEKDKVAKRMKRLKL